MFLYARHAFVYTKLKGQEDVKKLICSGFRGFIFDPKACRHPSSRLYGIQERFFNAEFAADLKIDFFTSSCPRTPQT
jgi:hypothetical protein